jgi:AcrR family transcriptional regulator
MGRPKVVSTDQILQAARELFLEQGFSVTTAAIARRAGVSEGSIFKRFSTKEQLFFSALGVPEPTWMEEVERRAGQGDVRENLTHILIQLIDFFLDLVPRLSMLWASRALSPGKALAFWQCDEDPPPLRGLRTLTRYFEKEAGLSRIRPGDEEVCARMLLGSAQNYVFFSMFGFHLAAPIPKEEYARRVASVLLEGMAPRGAPAPRPSTMESS